MSYPATIWAMKQRCGSPTASRVLIALADFYNDEKGCAWPRLSTLAEICEISISTVTRALKRLEDLQLITRRQRKRRDGSLTSSQFFLAFRKVTGGMRKLSRKRLTDRVTPDPSGEGSNPRKRAHLDLQDFCVDNESREYCKAKDMANAQIELAEQEFKHYWSGKGRRFKNQGDANTAFRRNIDIRIEKGFISVRPVSETATVRRLRALDPATVVKGSPDWHALRWLGRIPYD